MGRAVLGLRKCNRRGVTNNRCTILTYKDARYFRDNIDSMDIVDDTMLFPSISALIHRTVKTLCITICEELISDCRHLSSRSTGRQSRHSAVSLLSFSLEKHLNPEFLIIFIKPSPKSSFPPIYLSRLQLEAACLVWLRSN